jgi:hypothetical protein
MIIRRITFRRMNFRRMLFRRMLFRRKILYVFSELLFDLQDNNNAQLRCKYESF